MITRRAAADRGHFDHGWLNTNHTFSFGQYRDPRHMGFRSLRVMNEDWIGADQGFGMHGHQDMEILTYVLSGSLRHEDSLGNGEVLRPGELQRMTAGSGIRHSEFNPSGTEPVHLYQIWLLPEEAGLQPGYEQKAFAVEARQNRLQLVASRTGEEGSLLIHQDARVYLAELAAGASLSHTFAAGRHGWLQILQGQVAVRGEQFTAGDGAAVSDESELRFSAGSAEPASVMLFDLA